MMLMLSIPQIAIKPLLRLRLLLLMLCLLPVSLPAQTTSDNAEAVDDVRVLIDISGSMKRTDPHNLRRPALRLFTSLLPKGSNAGVWTFGQWTNMLVKNGPVDAQWKNNARKAASEISSRGLYTNIEDALRRATWNWKRPDNGSRRSLILLTDGLVDIAKDPAENTASRERILNDLLPRLQKAGVTVHTIALSNESDAPLLQQLAAATGGWFETIESADGLERLFLRMFEKVSKADTLPLKGNKVSIDNSINEATFLVFRRPGAKPTTVTAPDGGSFGQHQLPGGVEWYEDERYDLITVQSPPPGEWTINADVDPDNRVMVITDLRMKNTGLPNDLAVAQPLLFTAQLEQKGKIIDRPDFLQFVKVTLTQVSDSGVESHWRLRDDGKQADLTANDGIFSSRLGESLVEGEHEFILDVDGITFKRNKHQLVKVYGQPVDAQLEPLGDDRFALTIVPYVSLIDPGTMHIEVEHMLPSGRLEKMPIPQVSTAEWRLELDAHNSIGEHELTAYISGQRNDGSPVEVQLGPIHFEAGGAVATHQRTPVQAPQPEHHEKPAVEVETHEEPPHVPEKEVETAHAEEDASEDDSPPAQISWGLIIGIIVGLTALIGGLVFAGIKLWPKIQAMRNAKKENKEDSPAEKEEKPSKAEAKPEPPPAEPEPEPEKGIVDVDQTIDELLSDGEPAYTPDPELDLGADDADAGESETEVETPVEVEETAEMDTDTNADIDAELEAAMETEVKAETETGDDAKDNGDDAQEIAEIPEDLISLSEDSDEEVNKT